MLLTFPTLEDQPDLIAEVENFPQVKDYLQNVHPELWKKLESEPFVYALLDTTEERQGTILRPEIILSPFTGYDVLIISHKVEGEALFTSLAAALAAAITSFSAGLTAAGITASVISPLAAGILGTIGAGLIMMGVTFGVGQLLQMLAPNQKMGADPSIQTKNYIFNGIPNVREQGGCVPLVFGDCLFGGVIIGMNITNIDTDVSGTIDLDNTVKRINFSNIAAQGGGGWRRVK